MRKLAVLVLIAAIAAAGCTPDEIIQPDEIIDNGETELLDPSLVWSEAQCTAYLGIEGSSIRCNGTWATDGISGGTSVPLTNQRLQKSN